MALISQEKFFANVQYVLSAATVAQLPDDRGAEVAFAGRSNAGKSSAINAITGRKALAKTSKTPGRTQTINFFTVGEHYRLVDLPGYGYAKVAQDTKIRWQKHLANYLQSRQSLRGLLIIMDIRHPLQPVDIQLLDWCEHVRIPTHIVLTKADKLSRGAAKTVLHKTSRLLAGREPAPSVQLFSATEKQGVEQAREIIITWLQH